MDFTIVLNIVSVEEGNYVGRVVFNLRDASSNYSAGDLDLEDTETIPDPQWHQIRLG